MTDVHAIIACYRSGQISEAEMVDICREWPEVEEALRETTVTHIEQARRTRIITDMCMTFRDDYLVEISEDDAMYTLSSGMTRTQREGLFNQMAQIYDNVITPLLGQTRQEKPDTGD